jgi:hypothetical protein
MMSPPPLLAGASSGFGGFDGVGGVGGVGGLSGLSGLSGLLLPLPLPPPLPLRDEARPVRGVRFTTRSVVKSSSLPSSTQS